MNSRASCAFLERSGFAPGDRLAVVLIQRTARRVVQRILAVEKAMAPGFQQWLREMNVDRQFEIYASVNSIRPDSVQRTKHDIAAIRHLFLDFDTDAQARVRELLTRSDLPRPTAVINSSRNHWQVLWQVTAFAPSRAEALQRGLARQAGPISRPPTAPGCSGCRDSSTTNTRHPGKCRCSTSRQKER